MKKLIKFFLNSYHCLKLLCC